MYLLLFFSRLVVRSVFHRYLHRIAFRPCPMYDANAAEGFNFASQSLLLIGILLSNYNVDGLHWVVVLLLACTLCRLEPSYFGAVLWLNAYITLLSVYQMCGYGKKRHRNRKKEKKTQEINFSLLVHFFEWGKSIEVTEVLLKVYGQSFSWWKETGTENYYWVKANEWNKKKTTWSKSFANENVQMCLFYPLNKSQWCVFTKINCINNMQKKMISFFLEKFALRL